MVRKRPFELLYDPAVAQHLAAIDRRHHGLIRKTILDQLRFEPQVETRNRKPLIRASSLGTAWALRFGPQNRLRVFYGVEVAAREVHILAIGLKVGNRLVIGGEEFEL
jgi:hypothetical protein